MAGYTDQELLDAGFNPALLPIIRRESRGRSVGWEGLPGSRDYSPGGTDLSGYPLKSTGFPAWPGKMGPEGNSTAAGVAQIVGSTWDPIARKLGVSGFSLQDQAKVANELYRQSGTSPWAASAPGYRSKIQGYDPALGATHIDVQKDIPPEADNSLLLYAGILDALGGESGKEDTSKPPIGTLQADTAGQPTPGAAARTKPEQGDELLNAIRDRLDQTHPPNQLSGQPIAGIPTLQQASMPLPGGDQQTDWYQGKMPPVVGAEPPGTAAAPGTQDRMPTIEGTGLPADRMQGASLYDGVLNALKQFNPIGSAQAAETAPTSPPSNDKNIPVPAPQPPKPPGYVAPPAGPAQSANPIDSILRGLSTSPMVGPGMELLRQYLQGPQTTKTPGENQTSIPTARDALKPSAALPADPQWSEIEKHIESALKPFQVPESQKGLDITTPEGFRQAALDPAGLQGATDVALSFGPGAMNVRLPTTAHMQEASKSIQKFFSPTTVDDASREAERVFREERGLGDRATQMAEGQMSGRGPLANPAAQTWGEAFFEPWRPLVARHVPELQSYIASVKAGVIPPTQPALLDFLDFVEGRTRTGAAYAGPPELRDLADILRDIYDNRAAEIAAEPSTSWAGFIQDYFPHMWKDPQQAAQFGSATGRQGSGRQLRQRGSIPTIGDGIRAGLEPVSPDPIETTMRYVTQIDRYLAHNRIFRIGRQLGNIRFFQPGREPPGWMQLKGRLAQRAVSTGGQPGALGLTAYAPEGYARVYNNGISTGFMGDPLGSKWYTSILRAKNGLTQMVLALSGFHPMAMSQETVASALSNSIQHLQRGDIGHALKEVGLAAMLGAKAIGQTVGKGRKFERQYAGVQDYGPDWERLADLYARGGGQPGKKQREWAASEAGNFITSFRRGTTMLEMKAGLKHIAEGEHIVSQGARAVGFMGEQIGRIMDTISSPVFDVMIPRIKKAAFFDEMSEWLAQHPQASMDEQIAQSRTILDTVDDRFGEMMMDNVFWGQRTKQAMQIATFSLGWELGSVRSLGGGLAFDPLRGRFSPRVRYTIGLATAVAIQNSVYQYLKTGKTPGEDIGGLMSRGGALDLLMPRTGGKTPEGAYERSLAPGFIKDVLGYWHDPLGELAGKLGPPGKLALDTLTGRDEFTGKTIAPFAKYTPEWFKRWADHVMGAMRPIPTKQETYKGSNISTIERYLGYRPAPEYQQNPERIDQIEYSVRMKDLQSEMRSLVAHGARTTQEPKYIQQRTKEIQDEMRALTQQYQETLKKDRANRQLYFPPKKSMEFREAPGQVLQ